MDDHFCTKKPKRLLEKEDAKPSMLINDISRMFGHRVRRESERAGISHGNRKLLMELSHEDGVSQLSLVKHTHLSAPTVSVALSKLEADGLVRREADVTDLRQVKVYITDKGREKDDFIREKCHETEEIMLDGISKDEYDSLITTLKKILSNLIDEEEK